ncbi:NYN domain-containing protein [Candidatus Babeliales bacterium]|nr:NYN domain-containing protein [Candidatus Babeliales bacterium]
MVIIIDGYNLLRSMFPKEKGQLTRQRDQLIKSLGIYKDKKDHEVIIVFDGGFFRHASREVYNGVVVMFAGKRKSADDWIFEYVKKNAEKEIFLVSNDNELRGKCSRFKVDFIGTQDFEDLLTGILIEDVKNSLTQKETITKYQQDDEDDFSKELDNQALDILMEQAGVDFHKDEDDGKDFRKKKQPSIKSKEEKRLRRKFKKL